MIGEVLAVLGASFMVLAALGVVRFNDPLARMHALTKASTLGVLLMLTGAAINLEGVNDVTSVVLAAILHVLTSPPASNMVSRAIYVAGVDAHTSEIVDEGAGPLGLHPADDAP